jgi:hypothetical protein
MDKQSGPPSQVLKALLETVAKVTHSYAMSFVVSIASLVVCVAQLSSSDIFSWKVALVGISAGLFFAVGLLTNRIRQRMLFLEVSTGIRVRVMLDQAKEKADTAKEVALSLTYLGHLRKRHFRVKVFLLASSAALAVLGIKFPTFDLLALASTPVAFFALILLKELVIEYRIRHGFFGTSQSEAREMIRFLIENSTDIDFTDSGGKLRRTLLPEAVPHSDPLPHPPSGRVEA